MKVRVDEECWRGRAIDLRGVRSRCGVELDVQRVAAAVRGDEDGIDGGDEECDIAIDCPDPGPAHEHVGVIRAGMVVRRRAALAAAARSLGGTAPQADELAAVRDRLDALDAPEIDLRDARRRVADASDEEAALRERVATLQGRVQARREADGASDAQSEVESRLAEATRRLSEVETERIAAEQALARARDRAAANRERRRERLRLQDRRDNLRRAAREHLAETVRESFESARDEVPDEAGESVAEALAVARAAELDAPVVLAGNVGAFGSADAAARWLDAPVIRL